LALLDYRRIDVNVYRKSTGDLVVGKSAAENLRFSPDVTTALLFRWIEVYRNRSIDDEEINR